MNCHFGRSTELHEGLIVAARVETNRYLFGAILIHEKAATNQYSPGIEHRVDGFSIVVARVKVRGPECRTSSLTGALGLWDVCFRRHRNCD